MKRVWILVFLGLRFQSETVMVQESEEALTLQFPGQVVFRAEDWTLRCGAAELRARRAEGSPRPELLICREGVQLDGKELRGRAARVVLAFAEERWAWEGQVRVRFRGYRLEAGRLSLQGRAWNAEQARLRMREGEVRALRIVGKDEGFLAEGDIRASFRGMSVRARRMEAKGETWMLEEVEVQWPARAWRTSAERLLLNRKTGEVEIHGRLRLEIGKNAVAPGTGGAEAPRERMG